MDMEKVALAATSTSTSDEATVPPEETAVVPEDQTLARDPIAQRKIDEIESACDRRDIKGLRRLAESAGGFLSDQVRRRACRCHRQRFQADCWLTAYSRADFVRSIDR